MTSDVYDSDDAMKRSPRLVAQKIDYKVHEPPPPFLPPESPKREATEEDAIKGTPGRSHPNRPDIADFESENPISDHWPPPPPPDRRLAEGPQPDKDKSSLKKTVQEAFPPLHPRDCPGHEAKPVSPPVTLPPPEVVKKEFMSPVQRPRLPSISALDTRSGDQPRLSPPFSDSIKCSPEDPARISLPSLQSPQSCPGGSPGTGKKNTQALPSIQSALSSLTQTDFPPPQINKLPPPNPYRGGPGCVALRGDAAQRPMQFPSQHIPPSPFSHFSPTSTKDMSNNPSPASQPAFWRTPSQSQSEIHHGASPYEMPPVSAKSPTTGYPTPTDQVSARPGDRASFSSNPSSNETGTPGNYKCNHPGCTAAPFQTQYLLNSHANVHSQDRPHFCPVEGCPRGVGGKGFKRKNEMMRHGLVHNSPGYVCPFCPDQQHRYPRPDNLQRHVRVHHVDKSKDDPILRQVLAQRPAGSTRWRRRRVNT